MNNKMELRFPGISANEGFARICALKEQLDATPYEVNRDYVEARSLVTVAYIILKEVIEE